MVGAVFQSQGRPLLLLAMLLSASQTSADAIPCSDELCVMRSLKEGPPLPKSKKTWTQAKGANQAYLACLADNLDIVTWLWPQDGKDSEHIKWVLETTWDACSHERAAATDNIAKALHETGGYNSLEEESKAAERYRSGASVALYLLRFKQIGKFEAFTAL